MVEGGRKRLIFCLMVGRHLGKHVMATARYCGRTLRRLHARWRPIVVTTPRVCRGVGAVTALFPDVHPPLPLPPAHYYRLHATCYYHLPLVPDAPTFSGVLETSRGCMVAWRASALARNAPRARAATRAARILRRRRRAGDNVADVRQWVDRMPVFCRLLCDLTRTRTRCAPHLTHSWRLRTGPVRRRCGTPWLPPTHTYLYAWCRYATEHCANILLPTAPHPVR